MIKVRCYISNKFDFIIHEFTVLTTGETISETHVTFTPSPPRFKDAPPSLSLSIYIYTLSPERLVGRSESQTSHAPQVLQDLQMHLLLVVNGTELLERYRYTSISIAVVAVVAASIDRL